VPEASDRFTRGSGPPPAPSGPESTRLRPPASTREPSFREPGFREPGFMDEQGEIGRYSPPSSSLRRKKILIVDDSFTAIMMCRAILSKRAYDIVTARDGREAIDKALQERPDLILMDVVMPHMDGFQACMRLRAMETTKHVPIFLLTTRGEAESVAQGFASGCNAYVSKPLNGPELLAKIKSYLGE
jgi:CheY-like chemotaxis protein